MTKSKIESLRASLDKEWNKTRYMISKEKIFDWAYSKVQEAYQQGRQSVLDELGIAYQKAKNETLEQAAAQTAYASEAGCVHESDGLVYLSLPEQYNCKKCGQFYR